MKKGFVFGKFYPFHKGHQGLIQFALSKCDHLSILICCSDSEKIDGQIRKGWIEDTFPNHPNISILVYHYSEHDLPNTSESSLYVSEKWSVVFKELLPDCELLFTSEAYGKYVANFMKIQSIEFDIARILFPISATLLRQNIFDYWDYLPDSVKKYFTTKVVVLGTESTGKTTLTQALAQYYHGTPVLEAAREIISNSNSFEMTELQQVAIDHAKNINESVSKGTPFIIIDTDIHTTLSYAHFSLNESLEVDSFIYDSNKAHLYLYLSKDFPFSQDGTRLEESKRNLLDESHRKTLKKHKIPYIEINGGWNERFRTCIQKIDEYILYHKSLF